MLRHARSLLTFAFVLGTAAACGDDDPITTPITIDRAPLAPTLTAKTDPATAVVIDILAAAGDPDGDTVTLTEVGTPQFGETEDDLSAGTVTYTPEDNFVGTDVFSYTIEDSNGNEASGAIFVLVPIPSDVQAPNRAPVAQGDVVRTAFETEVVVNALANDTDADQDPLTLAEVSDPDQGTAAIDGGNIRYTPDAGFSGTDVFSYTISDGKDGTDSALVVVTVGAPGETFTLSIFHNNDGESDLFASRIPAAQPQGEFGGAARFVSRINMLRDAAEQNGRAVVTLSSGDNFLAGPEFNASLSQPLPFLDSVVLSKINYDAICLGNHDFDFGPDVLGDFISGIPNATFLSANLDVSGEPQLAAFADAGRIAASTVVVKNDRRIGIIGATTENLRSISSPRNVIVNSVAPAVQAEVDQLEAEGVNIIILISHLQGVAEDRALIANIRGVDVVIAGGGDELLANGSDLLVPGDAADPTLPYPLQETDSANQPVYVVTTPGQYQYIGQLNVSFDEAGLVLNVDPGSGPKRVAARIPGGPALPDAVTSDPELILTVEEPLMFALEEQANNFIAVSEVPLDCRRNQIRARETNYGNLITDALLWEAQRRATEFGVNPADIVVTNGGGIRADTVLAPGPYSELDTLDALPFPNFLSVVENISPAGVKNLLENIVSRLTCDGGNAGGGTGRFGQVAGFTFTYRITDCAPANPSAANDVIQFDSDGNITQFGSRILDVILNDGTVIITDGVPAPGAPNVNVATVDFLARGGDQYPFASYAPDGTRQDPLGFTTLGVTYQQALFNYIQASVDEGGIEGFIAETQYPENGLFPGELVPSRVQRKEVAIHHIQGSRYQSRMNGVYVHDVEGVVLAVGNRDDAIYIQTLPGQEDASDVTSEGLVVFVTGADNTAHGCQQGSPITVTGQVNEFIGGGLSTGNLATTRVTTLLDIAAGEVGLTCSSTLTEVPAPVVIGMTGRMPPSQVIYGDSTIDDPNRAPLFDIELDRTITTTQGIGFYESLEAMHVRVIDPVAVGGTRVFGEIPVLTDGGNPAAYGPRTPAGGMRAIDDPRQTQQDYNPEIINIELDEVKMAAGMDRNVPLQVKTGDQLTGSVDGVVDYSFGKFQLRPYVSLVDFTEGTLADEATGLIGTATQLTVATFNVLNLNPSAGTRYDDLASTIVNDMGAPDIIGLQEVQDDSGSSRDTGNDGTVTSTLNAALLTGALAAVVGGPGNVYQYVDITPLDNDEGGVPGGNIRNAFLYRTDRVTLIERGVPDATTATQVQDAGGQAELSLSPGRVYPNDPAWIFDEATGFENTRRSMAAEFDFNGQTVFVVNSHLKSKRGDNPLFGRYQPPFLLTEVQRTQQAAVLNGFVREILAIDETAQVVVLGDFNEFETKPPIQALAGSELENLVERLPIEDRYTFIFNGNAQVLDHVLVTSAVASSAEVDIVHVNADLPDSVRSSDHEPIVIRFTP